MLEFDGSPYLVPSSVESFLRTELDKFRARVEALRTEGRLTEATLRRYYGQTRFEQVAESNALEGSTLSVGETELAVTRGITITGHDPGYSRDAQALARALDRLAEIAQARRPPTIADVKEVHELILGDRPSAGHFRTQPVRISGSDHVPPETWREVMSGMEAWEAWSMARSGASCLLRAAVLHAWLVHIHPFLDGNGRTARAIGNLEMIRSGYPPVIIRARRDRSRYLEALASSDQGDISLVLNLLLDRAGDALRDLERAATREQGFDAARAMVRQKQERHLSVWSAAVELMVSTLDDRLSEQAQELGATLRIQRYRDSLNLDEYLDLCQGGTISQSWTFRVELDIPALPRHVRLAWAGHRSREMLASLPPKAMDGPSLFWSEPNIERFPPWRRLDQGPGCDEVTLVDDRWFVRRGPVISSLSTLELVDAIAKDLLAGAANG
ncbi:MAG: Fic family protein [Nannocystis sp.]|nr:Fic family protein [Nannocystis sp.]